MSDPRTSRSAETVRLMSRAFARTPHEKGAIESAKIGARVSPEQAYRCYKAIAIIDDLIDGLKAK